MKKLFIAAALAAATVPSVAQAFTYYLVEQWFQNGNRFCRYSNGAVIPVGISLCPLSIQG